MEQRKRKWGKVRRWTGGWGLGIALMTPWATLGIADAAPAAPRADNRRPAWTIPAHALPNTLSAQAAPPPALAAPKQGPSAQPARNGKRPAQPLLGVWFTINDMGTLRDQPKLQAAIQQLGQLGVTTLYPVVWNSGIAYYLSSVTRERNLQDFNVRGIQGQDPLSELIPLARAQGMQVFPWFEFGFMAPPSSNLAKRNPSWLTQKQDGRTTSLSAAGEVVWLNPFRPEVQQLLTDLALEVITLYDVDGVQFDDHFSLPIAFGYDAYTKALYLRETGRDVPPNPQDQAWVRWRANKLTSFLRRLRTTLKARKPDLLLSLSPNYADFAYKLQIQDWRTWVKEGLVDEVVVQVYRPDVASFTAELDRPEFQDKKVPMAVALMAGQRLRPTPLPLLQGMMEAAKQRGLGVGLFHYGPLWEFTTDPGSRLRELEGILRDN